MFDSHSKEFSWEYVVSDRQLTRSPCELVYAYLVPSAENDSATIYDGHDTSGRAVVKLQGAYGYGTSAEAMQSVPFDPPAPVYCPHGLYVDNAATGTRLFVMWRDLPE